MTVLLAARGVRVVLLDIEGTTTPIAFVHDVLFPFARRRLQAWIHRRAESVEGEAVLRALGAEHAADEARGAHPPAWRAGSPGEIEASAVAYANWLMDQDCKSPGLKTLQGLIWEDGYRAGELRGVVFPDVAGAIQRWCDAGLRVAVYSSGSELAQRRLFESTSDGDLTPCMAAFFDTAVGPKVEAASYARIAAALGVPPRNVLFVSDVTRELGAARAAGFQVALSIRPGNSLQPDAGQFERVTSFDEIAGGVGERVR